MMNFSTLINLLTVVNKFMQWRRPQQAQQSQNVSQAVQGTNSSAKFDMNNYVNLFIKANGGGR